MISSQAIRKMFMYFLGSTYMQHVTLYILRLEQMQGWKSYGTEVLATTSCKIVEALCIKIVFPNSVHHQGRTLASVRDFPLSSFRSCPCKLEYMYFMELLPLSIDFSSYSVSSFLSVTTT